MRAREQETVPEAPRQGSSKWAGPNSPGRTHFLLYYSSAGVRQCWASPFCLPLDLCTESSGVLVWRLPVGRMEDEEGPEYGKPDFVLLDQLTMEEFMKNLQLR